VRLADAAPRLRGLGQAPETELGRRWLLLGLAVSVASNVLAQYPELVANIAPAVSAWPPVALSGTHRLLHRRR